MEQTLDEVTLELTQSCPNKCLFCSSYAIPCVEPALDLSAILCVVKEARELGVAEIALSGGEPLCYPFLRKVLSFCLDSDIAVAIFTSGQDMNCSITGSTAFPFTAWNELVSDALRNRLRLVFNIQSSQPEVHDRITQMPGSHDRSMQSMRAALAAALRVEVNMVPNGVTHQSLTASINALFDEGVTRVHLLRMVEQGYYHEHEKELRLTDHDLEMALKLVSERFGADSRIRTGIPLSTAGKRCTAGVDKLVVRYDGEILPCEAFKDHAHAAKFSLGNVAKGDTLSAARDNAAGHALLCSLRDDHAVILCKGMDSCAALRYQRKRTHQPTC